MPPSRLIAGLIGPLLAAIGIGMMLNIDLFPAMAQQLAGNYGLVFIAGMLALVAGVAIVRVHNVWTGWAIVVTILGWLSIVGGLLRMWFPDLAAPIATTIGGNAPALWIAAAVNLALGAFLCFKAYGPER